MSKPNGKPKSSIMVELEHHLPYTAIGSLIAMAGVWWFATQHLDQGEPGALFEKSRSVFHLLHPLHVCLSAIATTSFAWRLTRKADKALGIGVLGTVIPCGFSDYVFPYIGGRLLGQHMTLHMCILDEPLLFFPFLLLGILGGFWAEERITGSHLFSHGSHVFISSTASLFYLISFGFTAWMTDVRLVFPAFLTIVLAVWVPCCVSDIIVPTAAAHHRRASDSS